MLDRGVSHAGDAPFGPGHDSVRIPVSSLLPHVILDLGGDVLQRVGQKFEVSITESLTIEPDGAKIGQVISQQFVALVRIILLRTAVWQLGGQHTVILTLVPLVRAV